MAQALKPGDVLLVENTRFYKEEEGKAKVADDATDEQKKAAKAEMKARQKEFAGKLALLGDGEIYVNDAFGSAHRAHGSTAVVCQFYKKSVAGFLMEKEIDYLGRALSNPERPFVAILGGAKVSDKVNVITNLLDKVNSLIIGGAMAYTFYRAKGLPTGKSLVEADKIDLARDILAKARAKGVTVLLPVKAWPRLSVPSPVLVKSPTIVPLRVKAAPASATLMIDSVCLGDMPTAPRTYPFWNSVYSSRKPAAILYEPSACFQAQGRSCSSLAASRERAFARVKKFCGSIRSDS